MPNKKFCLPGIKYILTIALLCVVGLHGKVLVAGWAIGVAFVSSCEKLPPYPIEPMLVRSKMDKAKSISDSGSSSVITLLRGGKTCGEMAVERQE